MHQTLASSIRVSVLVILAGTAGVLGGCDNRSEHVQAIETASQDLVALTGGGTYAAPADARKKGLDAAAAKVQGAVTDGTDAEKGPASVLTANTQNGLSLSASDEARSLDRDSRNMVTRLNAVLSDWVTRKATAAAAESFDPSAQIAELQASKSQRAQRISTERARLADLESRHAGLTSEAAAKHAAAAAAQAKYVDLMSGVLKLSAVEAAPVVEEANRARREGDTARLAGSRTEAEAAEIAPLISELKLIIAQLENQNKNLDATEAELAARAAAYRAEAAAANAAANVAANDIDATASSLKELHEGALATAFQNAESLLSKAAGNASKAGQSAPTSGKLAVLNAQSALADLHWARAMSAANFAATFELLATTTPRLPQAAAYAADAAKAREQQTASLASATAAFEAAKSAASAARIQGPARERLEALGELLEKSRSVTSGEAADVAATFNLKVRKSPVAETGGASATPSTDAPTAEAAPVDPELIAMLDAMDAATQAGEDVTGYMLSSKPGMIEAMTGTDRLRTAVKKAYGKDMKELLAGTPLAQMAEGGSLSSKDLKITMNGADAASAMLPGAPIRIGFKKIDGAWKVDLDAMGPMAMAIMPIGKAFAELAAEVEAGSVPEDQFGAKLMEKVQGAMGGMGGMPIGDK